MDIKELFQKFEEDKEFVAIKDAAGLDAFLSGRGIELTAEEKAQALAYLQPGKLPPGNGELKNAPVSHSGRNLVPSCAKCGSEKVVVKHIGPQTVLKCHSCGATIDPDGIIFAIG